MNSITQDMKFRQSLMNYAKKYGVSRASRKYNKSRSYIYFWLKRWDGSVESLAVKSRRCCDFKKLEAVLERRLAKAQSNEYEPKEKAVAASAEIPVRHPAIIRRRKNTGRSC